MAEVKLSQRADIIRHLIENESITAWEAIKEYGSTRLTAIIYELRKQGWDIKSEMVTTKNRYGNSVTFARYHLVATPKKTTPEQTTEAIDRSFKSFWMKVLKNIKGN